MLENKNVSLHRYDTMVDVSGSDLQLLSSRHFLAMSMTYFLASEADLTGVCISITTIGLAGCLKKAGWWYKGNRNVACRVGYVCWKKILSDSNPSETLKTIVVRAIRTARRGEVNMAVQWRPLLNGQFGE